MALFGRNNKDKSPASRAGNEDPVESHLRTLDDFHGPKEERARAAKELGDLGDRRAVKALLEALRTDTDGSVTWACAKSLVQLADPTTIDRVLAMYPREITFTNQHRACGMAYVLGELGDARVFGILVDSLDDANKKDAIETCCRALVKIFARVGNGMSMATRLVAQGHLTHLSKQSYERDGITGKLLKEKVLEALDALRSGWVGEKPASPGKTTPNPVPRKPPLPQTGKGSPTRYPTMVAFLLRLPESVARENLIFPSSVKNGVVRLMTASDDAEARAKLGFILNCELEFEVVDPKRILELINRHFGYDGSDVLPWIE